ncbi:MAG TPA: hypothetical protein VF814_00115 [Casimicrobiaceae bacterium]
MHQPNRQTVETVRDGAAARVVGARSEEAATRVLQLPRRKRYTINLDLDAVAPLDAEPCAPTAALDL